MNYSSSVAKGIRKTFILLVVGYLSNVSKEQSNNYKFKLDNFKIQQLVIPNWGNKDMLILFITILTSNIQTSFI